MQDVGIFALSSGAPPSGVAVFRLSGKGVMEALGSLIRGSLPAARRASLRKIYQGQTQIDQALILVFPAPDSFTGEDCVEIHTHGGRAVINAVSDALMTCGLRPAEAGEFTKRAFHNGRMDLTEAEALADLIHAETEAQRRQALQQMEGGLRGLYEAWREKLVRSLALVEAEIDFSDEELPENLFEQVRPTLQQIMAEMTAHLGDNHRGERIRSGIKIAVLGAPNVGKSSLINALAKRDVAIVSDIAGTTRDIIEVHLDLGGYPVTIADTAGLREGGDVIEQEGMRRAAQWAAGADLQVLMYDEELTTEIVKDARVMLLQNKIDVSTVQSLPEVPPNVLGVWQISVKTGEGVAAWLDALTDWVRGNYGQSAVPTLSRARHRVALEETLGALQRALEMGGQDTVLAAEDMRLAARALGRITGRVDVEDLLDVIFSEFCIGK